MRIVRIFLQLLIAAFFLAVLSGVLLSPITPISLGNLAGVSVFLVVLFVATFSLGEQKKESRLVLGYPVNPKVLGLMMVLGGLLMFFFSWRIISGQPMGSGVRGQALATFIRDYGPWTPASILISLGLALGWYGYRMFRGRYGHKISGVTIAQVDKAWIQHVGIYGGVMLTAIGALGTLAMAWATFAANNESRVPLFLSAPLILCALAMLYAGIRVLWAKLAR